MLAPLTVVGLAFQALEAGLIVVRFIAPPFDGPTMDSAAEEALKRR